MAFLANEFSLKGSSSVEVLYWQIAVNMVYQQSSFYNIVYFIIIIIFITRWAEIYNEQILRPKGQMEVQRKADYGSWKPDDITILMSVVSFVNSSMPLLDSNYDLLRRTFKIFPF